MVSGLFSDADSIWALDLRQQVTGCERGAVRELQLTGETGTSWTGTYHSVTYPPQTTSDT